MNKLFGVKDRVEVVKEFRVPSFPLEAVDAETLPEGTKASILCFNANRTVKIKLDESGDVWNVPVDILKRI